MNTDELYHQRLTRILKAVALEAPDRTPVVLEYSGFAAKEYYPFYKRWSIATPQL
ncbi:MAG: hypothetical protein V3V39_05350 [Desulfobacterales bacterium]|jgi:hypothetical protein